MRRRETHCVLRWLVRTLIIPSINKTFSEHYVGYDAARVKLGQNSPVSSVLDCPADPTHRNGVGKKNGSRRMLIKETAADCLICVCLYTYIHIRIRKV